MRGAPAEAEEVLRSLENRLDPAQPEKAGGLQVLGYGEVSACLRLDGLDGWIVKRMSGFADEPAARAYASLVDDYLVRLTARGVSVVETHALLVPRPGRPPVVALLQPMLPSESLGHRLLVRADDAVVADAVHRVLATVLALHLAGTEDADGLEAAVDGQLSNWSFAEAEAPVLVDVGTPFMRRAGRHLVDIAWLERPIPPGLRAYYHRRALVGAYLDDYYDPRTVALDLLGNFHKEGRPDRIPLGIDIVNRWLVDHRDALGERAPLSGVEVESYYRSDADLLALYLRLRRADRFLRTRVLRRPYDFILPGHVRR
ncbi:DUF6206 family protein [Longivirga aurantiaca]|uniref:DUF6206 family protein n=1 Tax=Longivirga aurantiaca TaxID=1837743 RepID=A0ABW1T286_9ACTN